MAPTNPSLPGGGGYTVHGFYDVVPGKFGQVRNLNALSDEYGNQFENWNGVDITVNSRLKNGVTLQAGISTGKTMEDNCEIVAKLPEMNNFAAAVGTLPALVARGRVVPPRVAVPDAVQGLRRLHRAEDRGAGGGVVPQPARADRAAGAAAEQRRARWRSPPPTRSWPPTPRWDGRWRAARRASTCSCSSRTRTYLDRRNELDLRFGKILRFSGQRAVVSVDVYNALNSNARITVNQSYAAYPRPTEILNARLVKFSINYDF